MCKPGWHHQCTCLAPVKRTMLSPHKIIASNRVLQMNGVLTPFRHIVIHIAVWSSQGIHSVLGIVANKLNIDSGLHVEWSTHAMIWRVREHTSASDWNHGAHMRVSSVPSSQLQQVHRHMIVNRPCNINCNPTHSHQHHSIQQQPLQPQLQ